MKLIWLIGLATLLTWSGCAKNHVSEKTRQAQIAARIAREEASEHQRREDYIAAHPELSAGYKEAIRKGSVYIGMTQEQVIASLGEPYRDSLYQTSTRKFETWRYEQGRYRLNFVNGVLESLFDSKGGRK